MNAEKLATELERMRKRNALRLELARTPLPVPPGHVGRDMIASDLWEQELEDRARFPELYPLAVAKCAGCGCDHVGGVWLYVGVWLSLCSGCADRTTVFEAHNRLADGASKTQADSPCGVCHGATGKLWLADALWKYQGRPRYSARRSRWMCGSCACNLSASGVIRVLG